MHISDAVKQEVCTISLSDAVDLLRHPRTGGLLRIVLMLDKAQAEVDAERLLANTAILGNVANVIYFSNSKFHSNQLALRLRRDQRHQGRNVEVYDGDLPPLDRRQMEAKCNSGHLRGATLLATSAFELGVDIEGLDVCLIDQIPPARQALLQRIGRVGRRADRPGLVILGASLTPQDRRLLKDPCQYLCVDTVSSLPFSTHLEMLRLRHMLAAHEEDLFHRYARGNQISFRQVIIRHFGECPEYEALRNRFEEAYGDVVDMEGKYWTHNGFRGSVSQGKIPLREYGGFRNGKPVPKLVDGREHDIAWIDDISLFRDGHPEGVFLGHKGGRWRVVAYGDDWRQARNVPAGVDLILAKWLKTIEVVYVEQILENVATRGEWKDAHDLYEIIHDVPGTIPRAGKLIFGAWDFERRWSGYRKIDLSTRRVTRVTLAEVASRFYQAREEGEDFPFLHRLTYRTFGWQWEFGRIPNPPAVGEAQEQLQQVVQGLIEKFVTGRVECGAGDVIFELSLDKSAFCMFDSTPGGNGLSAASLSGSKMSDALAECLGTLDELVESTSGEHFRDYIGDLLNIDMTCAPKEVRDVIATLYQRWH